VLPLVKLVVAHLNEYFDLSKNFPKELFDDCGEHKLRE